MKTETIKIERKSEVLGRTGIAKTTLHQRIIDGTFPPSFGLGGRVVGWFSHEVDAILKAYAAGKSNDEVKALVISLVEQRQQAA